MAVLSFLTGVEAFSQQTGTSTGKSIIVLDASGSMWGQIDGQAKIDIAKQVVSDLLSTLDPNLELGLVAYGHRRKGDCTDIELLIPPGKVDRKAFADIVQGLSPKGKTPLTDAVEQAANHLKYTEEPADVILVSDGIETCGKDPCALARKLAATGVRFRSHVIGFDLTAEEAGTIRCLADETGGKFLPAQDAKSLQDALNVVVEEVISAPPEREEKEEPEPEPIPEVTLSAPDSVTAGAVFEASWEGENGKGDYITIVKKGTDDKLYGNSSYTYHGSPLSITALIDPGECELRYIYGKLSKVIARRPILVTKIEATVTAQAEVLAGASFDVEWTGPGNKGDYITIAPKDADPREYQNYKYATKKRGSPVSLRAGEVPGEFEVRYVTGQKRRILATTPIKVTPAAATVAGPEQVGAGSKFEVSWTGPANRGDYIAIVPKGEPRQTVSYAYAKQESPVTIKAGEKPGEFDVVYMTAGRKVLASVPITVVAATASLKAPAEIVAGAPIEIEWTGPGNQGDYITIAPPNAATSAYISYAYTKKKKGQPVFIDAPELDGDFELRYVTPKKNILARTPIKVVAAKVTLKAPDTATAGAVVSIEWSGPDNARDLIAIVPKGAKEGTYGSYTQTKKGSPLTLATPAEPGDAEIRYLTGKSKKTLAARPIKLTPADIKFAVAEKVAANATFRLEFSGAPNNPRDLIVIALPGNKRAEKTYYVSRGSPQEVKAPKKAGKYELRYITGKKRAVIATRPIEVVAE